MDLPHLLVLVRRRIVAIVLCLAAGTAGGYYLGHHGSPSYRTTARTILGVSINAPAQQAVGDTLQATQLTNNQINTYASVATSQSVAQRAIDYLGLQQSAVQVSHRLSAAPERLTSIIDVTATGSTPQAAQALADAAVKALSDEINQIEAGQPVQVQAKLLDAAPLPGAPTSPRPHLDLAVGILLGLLAGIATAALLEGLDRTVKSSAQGDALFEAPLLTAIPRRRGKTLVVGRGKDGPQGEPYRTLRTAVRFLSPDKPIRTLLVTSAGPGEGKTTTAANLAIAIALSGERVVVLDGDLRRAKLAQTFGLDRSVGVTSLVLGTATINDALQDWERGVKVLPSGPLPPNPSEIVGSQLFNQILQQLTAIADIVIIDAPPLLPVSDALALSVQVDGVLVVARHGSTSRAAAHEARSRLDSVGANLVGYVFNAVPAREARSYYAEYYYGPRGRQAPQRIEPDVPTVAGQRPG
ncbi:MAG: polysaccharide biosynthesis tyrosine autokinase [Mycobacteriales bacterium]